MDKSCPINLFSSVDLPTLGLPIRPMNPQCSLELISMKFDSEKINPDWEVKRKDGASNCSKS